MFHLNQGNEIQKTRLNFKEIKCKELDMSLFYFSAQKKYLRSRAFKKLCGLSYFYFKKSEVSNLIK